MASVVLKLEHLSKLFGEFKAVDDVSIDIQGGEVFTLLGPSGCGKTTTLRMIAGLETPDDGNILFGERVIVSASRGIFVPTHKRNLGMVFQSYAIWPHMTVFENVAYPLKLRRVKGREVRAKVEQVLDLVGLAGLENRQATQLSGGQQQRVAVARAVVYEPTILLLDEPFSNLDARLRKEMRVQLKILLKKLKITTVFVTHDQVEALSLSDRIAVMRAGRVEQIGSARDLYETPSTPFSRDFLGSTVLLKGKLGDDRSAECASIQFHGIPNFSLSVLRSTALIPSSGDVLVAIRPEDVQLVKPGVSGEDAGCLPGTVESLLFIGERYECQVKLSNDEVLSLHAPRTSALREGDQVRLKIPDEGISVWPA